ncbi:MAG TPA: polysaccharide biosynthesis C-terminal domain-containing protein [Ferruginibacter sp.]|nr:polysaccharide biosynthesis C-terminal domain-containing protein [Ferruginibacter sp.]
MKFSKLAYQSFSWRLWYHLSLFLLTICISRYFHAADSGWFNYIITIGSLLVLVAGFSLDAAVSYHLSKGTFSLNAVTGFILTWGIAMGVLASFVFYLLFRESYALTRLLYSSSLYIAGSILITIFQSVFYARHDFRLPHLVAVIFNLVLTLLLLAMFYMEKRISIIAFFQLYALCSFAQAIIFFSILARREKINPFQWVKWQYIKDLFKYASLVFAGNLLFFLVYRIDYFFVNRYCDPTELGNYIQVSKIVQVFLIIPGSMASIIFPAMARGDNAMAGRMMQLSRLMVSAFAFVLLLLAITGQWLFPFVFGASFDNMYEPFLWLIPGIICLTVIALLGAYFSGRDMARINLTGAVVALAFMITADMILIPVFHIRGAAIACSISYAAFLVYLLCMFKKHEQLPLRDFFVSSRKDWQYILSYLSILPK